MSREELLQNAVLFLLDPKVKESSLTSRITFLEGKGLSEGEIEEALRRAKEGDARAAPPSTRWGSGGPSRPGGAYGYQTGYVQPPPAIPRRDWRDVFIMAVISGGVVYGLTALARKYLVPHLQPPTTSSFQQTSTALTEQYDAAQAMLDELTASTKELQEKLDSDRERIGVVVEEVEGALRSVGDNEERWREEMREMRGEVESVRDLVPKMIEKHSAAQSASLRDLQNELRSLKALLQSRTQPAQDSASSPTSQGGPNGPNGVSATTAAANALLSSKNGGGRGIPAWQKAATPPPASPPANGEKGKGNAVDGEGEGSGSVDGQ